ncbi:hypothetical protein RchiOBHm_Chr4g0402781 [Rosa chinensis]|uniref:Uncharacterized protein n=1 Tax=Rosa chinensis TaxID=74649 RepID=A0A2P6QTD8_ROSCH|nr:hypothetical protein RchiOBHm_Chr4g0402781 [Rosa chinensis]
MKSKPRTSFFFLADYEIVFPFCRHNFEAEHCRRCSNHCFTEVSFNSIKCCSLATDSNFSFCDTTLMMTLLQVE